MSLACITAEDADIIGLVQNGRASLGLLRHQSRLQPQLSGRMLPVSTELIIWLVSGSSFSPPTISSHASVAQYCPSVKIGNAKPVLSCTVHALGLVGFFLFIVAGYGSASIWLEYSA